MGGRAWPFDVWNDKGRKEIDRLQTKKGGKITLTVVEDYLFRTHFPNQRARYANELRAEDKKKKMSRHDWLRRKEHKGQKNVARQVVSVALPRRKLALPVRNPSTDEGKGNFEIQSEMKLKSCT